MPRFSIILPFHNSAATLPDTIHGILAQEFTDWELLCVDDRSRDLSAAIVQDFAASDPRIRLLTSPGAGPSDARNHAAEQARGRMLAFCDADDIWHRAKLRDSARLLNDPSSVGCYGKIGFFNFKPDDCPTQSSVHRAPLTIDALLAENPVCTLSNLVVRADAFDRVGGFDRTMVHNEDLDLLIRLVGDGCRIDGIDALHVWYRTNPNGLSSDLDAMRGGRDRALQTAARYGVRVSPSAEAVYMRYLARRALRLDCPHGEAWRFARRGLACHLPGFLFPLRRGLVTALAAFCALGLPRPLRRALFSR